LEKSMSTDTTVVKPTAALFDEARLAIAGSVVEQALARLLGLLGLRISEALNIDIDHLGIERGHRSVRRGNST